MVCAVLLPLMAAACSSPARADAGNPSSRCADLVAHAVTSYFTVAASGQCVHLRSGRAVADLDLADFTAEPPPVFDLIDHPCGYHVRDHTFTFLVSNAADRAAGRLIILVDGSGWVLDVAKRLDRAPGGSAPVRCPAPTDAYVFRSS